MLNQFGMNTPQPLQTSVLTVHGYEGAQSIVLANNSSVLCADDTDYKDRQLIYLVATDNIGRKSVTILEYKEMSLDTYREMESRLKDPVSASTNDLILDELRKFNTRLEKLEGAMNDESYSAKTK